MFLCLSWLAQLLAGACTRRQRRRRTGQHGGHTLNNRLKETCSLVLPCTSSILDIHVLWSIDTCQNKVSADQFHVTISRAQIYNSSWSHVFLKLTGDQVLVLIGSQVHFRLTCWKQGMIVRKPVNTSPELQFIRIATFSSVQMFFAALFWVYGDYKTQNRKPNNKHMQKTSP